ncbi:hypothetical protein BGZ95_007435, partial [Linnemannia exigua]
MTRKSTTLGHNGSAHDRVNEAQHVQGNTPYNPICLDDTSSESGGEEDDNLKSALSDSH